MGHEDDETMRSVVGTVILAVNLLHHPQLLPSSICRGPIGVNGVRAPDNSFLPLGRRDDAYVCGFCTLLCVYSSKFFYRYTFAILLGGCRQTGSGERVNSSSSRIAIQDGASGSRVSSLEIDSCSLPNRRYGRYWNWRERVTRTV